MQTPAEKFDEWIGLCQQRGQLGPRFIPPKEIYEPFRDQMDAFENRLVSLQPRLTRKIEVYVDFVDDGRCNAAAWIYKDLGVVALCKGLILLPLDLFWRMFAHPAFLNNAGEARQEKRSAQHNDGVLSDFDALAAMRQKQGRSPYPVAPKGHRRITLARVCMDLIWRFIAMHETVHIIHGHVDYLLGNKPSVPFILEVSNPPSVPTMSPQDLDCQAIEMWADTMAAITVLRGFLFSSPMVGIYTGLDRVQDKLFFWSLATFTMFRFWEFTFDPADLHLQNHPPPLMRFSHLMGGVTYDIVKGLLSDNEFAEIVRAAVRTAEDGIAYCGGVRLKQEDLEPIFDPAVRAHRIRLAEHFDDVLFPECQKRAYMPLNQF